mmetsp:Transcript_14687/g.42801  ORF Transcript_14687/g.42801 Transcript_14687/m.42801 type:complete len:214 (-) Transcript_14687:26-667(-)
MGCIAIPPAGPRPATGLTASMPIPPRGMAFMPTLTGPMPPMHAAGPMAPMPPMGTMPHIPAIAAMGFGIMAPIPPVASMAARPPNIPAPPLPDPVVPVAPVVLSVERVADLAAASADSTADTMASSSSSSSWTSVSATRFSWTPRGLRLRLPASRPWHPSLRPSVSCESCCCFCRAAIRCLSNALASSNATFASVPAILQASPQHCSPWLLAQ